MQKVEGFRKHAEECRTLAGRARSLQECDMLLNMATTWDELTKAREQQIAQQQRIKGVASGPGGDARMNSVSIPIDSNDD
jgi:hypothetical protein